MGKYTYTSWGGAITRTLHTDPSDPGTLVQETSIELPDIFFERNRALGEDQKGHIHARLVARAPMTVYEQSIREDWDEARWARWLNDPDNAAFRVWPGRL